MESAKQERKDLGKMPGDFKQMSQGSFLSQHMSTPLNMGGSKSGMYMDSMAPKMDGPLKGNAFGKAMADNDGNYDAAKVSLAPKMHGSPMHKYDDVVLGGNIGDKSKTKPGKKDK